MKFQLWILAWQHFRILQPTTPRQEKKNRFCLDWNVIFWKDKSFRSEFSFWILMGQRRRKKREGAKRAAGGKRGWPGDAQRIFRRRVRKALRDGRQREDSVSTSRSLLAIDEVATPRNLPKHRLTVVWLVVWKILLKTTTKVAGGEGAGQEEEARLARIINLAHTTQPSYYGQFAFTQSRRRRGWD